MIKRTLFFESAGMINAKLNQLLFTPASGETRQVPIEDIGFVIIESPAVVLTSHAIQALSENNAAVVFCNASHMPSSMVVSMDGHSTMHRQTAAQLSATDAVCGRLWKQTVRAKLRNQARCLELGGRNRANKLRALAGTLHNGDPENVEGTAARLYYAAHFPGHDFTRDRDGPPPNAFLNYGYAVIRAALARALIGSGLLCAKGIHHSNQYNPFVLADDMMEPYRPFVDNAIFNSAIRDADVLDKTTKAALVMLLSSDVAVAETTRPMMNAMSMTSASLARCFLGESTDIVYPEFA
jgi:CRISP-associated protein Cas1